MKEPARLLLQHLDGQHDRATLIQLIAGWIEKSARPADTTPQQRATDYIEKMLPALARNALLIA